MTDPSLLELIRVGVDMLIIPIFGMLLSAQGRLSRMEGELKALYSIIDLLGDKIKKS